MARPPARSPDTACALSAFTPSIPPPPSGAHPRGQSRRARYPLSAIAALVARAGSDDSAGRHDGAGHQQEVGAVAPELGDAALCAATARDQPELDLRQTELG